MSIDEEVIIPPDPSSIERPADFDVDRVVVRPANDGDTQAIADHFARCFDEAWPPFEIDCSVADHVAWKMHSDPESASQQTVATLVDDDQFVISMTIWVRRPLWFRGEERVLLDVCDLSVHPDWRLVNINQKRRDVQAAGKFETQDMIATWLPNHPATRRSGLRRPILGNRVVVLWKPHSLKSLIAVPYRVGGRPLLMTVLKEAIRRRFRRSNAPRFSGQIVDLERFDDRTDAVWMAARAQFDFAVARTQDYLNWRYADPRAGQFELRAAVEDDTILGYCVTKPQADPAEIVDLLVLPDRLDALAALVGDAKRRVHRRGVDLHCWLPGVHPYVDTVRELGFYDSGRDPSLRYFGSKLTEEDLAFLGEATARVHVTEGDSDFV